MNISDVFTFLRYLTQKGRLSNIDITKMENLLMEKANRLDPNDLQSFMEMSCHVYLRFLEKVMLEEKNLSSYEHK